MLVRKPFSIIAPPIPGRLVVLLEKVLFVIVAIFKLEIAPPNATLVVFVAWLPLKVVLLRVNVPELLRAPPGQPLQCPFESVKFCKVRFAPLSILKKRKLGVPPADEREMVYPFPFIVRELPPSDRIMGSPFSPSTVLLIVASTMFDIRVMVSFCPLELAAVMALINSVAVMTLKLAARAGVIVIALPIRENKSAVAITM